MTPEGRAALSPSDPEYHFRYAWPYSKIEATGHEN